MANLKVYNLTEFGVDVDTDDLHVPTGAWRQAQNIRPEAESAQAGSVVTRLGLGQFNVTELDGPVIGGIALPAFTLEGGEPFLFLGFGD